MFNFIRKCFIPDYQNVKDKNVRERYGIVYSIFSILCNIILVICKLIISFITNSVSIRNDAFNNLSDCGSNIASIVGFKMSNKQPDSNHPYGHGRMEYVASMVVSFLIILMGFEALKDSFMKIINPSTLNSSLISALVLFLSIAVKFMMGIVNKKAGEAISSETLIATFKDSFSDCLVTGATLICVILYNIFHINLDAYMGFFVSILVLKSGFEIFKNVLATVLGKAPDKKLIAEIKKTINDHSVVLGIHDLLLHDYGPNEQFMSVHVEVDAKEPILEIHDEIDNIEQEIKEKYNILTTIHMDPIDTKDSKTKEVKEEVIKKIREISPKYHIHDFRMVKGSTHTNLVFDCVLPYGEDKSEDQIRKQIELKVKEINNKYRCVIQFDRTYE